MSKKNDKEYTQTPGNEGHGSKYVPKKGVEFEFDGDDDEYERKYPTNRRDSSSDEDDKSKSDYIQTPGNEGHGSKYVPGEGIEFEYEAKQDEDRKKTTKAEGGAKKSKRSRKHRRSRGHKRSRKHRRSRRHRK